jgi:CheY-like chemotaxis protein
MGGLAHVVVVEDQDRVRRVIVEVLEAVGYRTRAWTRWLPRSSCSTS